MKEIEKILRLRTSLPRWYLEVSTFSIFSLFSCFSRTERNKAVGCTRKFERNRSKWISKRPVDDISRKLCFPRKCRKKFDFFKRFFFFYRRYRLSTWVAGFRSREEVTGSLCTLHASVVRTCLFFEALTARNVCTSLENASRTLFRKVAYITVDFPTIWKLAADFSVRAREMRFFFLPAWNLPHRESVSVELTVGIIQDCVQTERRRDFCRQFNSWYNRMERSIIFVGLDSQFFRNEFFFFLSFFQRKKYR